MLRVGTLSVSAGSLRILLVTDAYPPMIGGATRSTQQLARELAARGHTIAVATAAQDESPAFEQDGEIEVHRLRDSTSRVPFVSSDPHQHIPPPFPDPEAVWRFRRLLRTFRPDVVHAYGWLTHSCLGAMRGMRVPLVLSARDYGNFCAVRTFVYNGEAVCTGPAPRKCLGCASRFYGPLKGAVAVAGVYSSRPLLRRRISALHTVSRYVEGVMRSHLFGPDTENALTDVLIEVIPNFRSDDSRGSPLTEILKRLPTEPYILYVGALRRIKGIPELLEAYRTLADPPPLVLIGTLAPETPPSFPPDVTVLLDVPHATVMAAWDGALFGVAPTVMPEALGNVVHEALSRGRAVIGTYPGGMTDLISDGENGLLVPAGDTGALARAMELLVRETELRERMGRKARQTAAGLVAQQIVPRFEALYRRVITASHADRAKR